MLEIITANELRDGWLIILNTAKDRSQLAGWHDAPHKNHINIRPKIVQLVMLIDQENEKWVRAARRISPNLLTQFLEIAYNLKASVFRYDFSAISPISIKRSFSSNIITH